MRTASASGIYYQTILLDTAKTILLVGSVQNQYRYRNFDRYDFAAQLLLLLIPAPSRARTTNLPALTLLAPIWATRT